MLYTYSCIYLVYLLQIYYTQSLLLNNNGSQSHANEGFRGQIIAKYTPLFINHTRLGRRFDNPYKSSRTSNRENHNGYPSINCDYGYDHAVNISPLFSNKANSGTDDVEKEISSIYSDLKNKKYTFNDLQKRLVDEGISLYGCNKPDDVIKRVAELNVYGKENLESRLLESDPDYTLVAQKYLGKYTQEYSACTNNERKVFISSLVDGLKTFDIDTVNLDDLQIVNLYAKLQAKRNINNKLPAAKHENEGKQTIECYKSEVDSIFTAYINIKDNKDLRDDYISSVREELLSSGVDISDCHGDEQLINRLAYTRVFPQVEEAPKVPPARKIKRIRNTNLGPFNAFSIFGDSFKELFDDSMMNDDQGNFFEGFMSDLHGDNMMDGMNLGNGFSILKDLASMFGLNNGFSQQVKFSTEDKNVRNEDVNRNFKAAEDVEEESEHIETDPSLLVLQQKAQLSGDTNLQSMINKSIQNPEMRRILKMAVNEGYDKAREASKNDRTLLYILEKLNDKHLF
ncbi:conserved hypothetical protein [Theileria equi strain WA]|uniref:Uncharacterized protein n=1 Tax=Theileria equi strain WA TaxID=1537102 RepID=L1LCN8_THEEQ|nr:conserved hypothetical protein [Theileria equi strain WA]EKX73106.1 conserved hypothetical protein [Theileria equi strain WA]|eukprot:XP_004832558.1 conserved hypothetical protein [Theileria equi strain WA]